MRGKEAVFSNKASGGADDWATPWPIFHKIEEHLDVKFFLDACASKENSKCNYFYDERIDGLKSNWVNSPVFFNPPYSEAAKWVEKAYNESLNYPSVIIVGLVAARTSNNWWHEFVLGKARIFYFKNRINFEGGKHTAPFPSAVIAYNYHKNLNLSQSIEQPKNEKRTKSPRQGTCETRGIDCE